MPSKSTNRPLYSVACACGARMTLDSGAFGRPHVCRSCGGSVTVGWGRDPKTRKNVPIAAIEPARSSDPARFPFLAVCGCGYSRPVSKKEARAAQSCPGCGKTMAVEKAPDPKELERLRAPVRGPAQPVVPLHLRPPLRTRVQPGQKTFECPCSERLLVRPGSETRPIQCYKCGRFHVVHVEGAPPPRPPPPATRRPAPRGPAKAAEPPKPFEAPKPALASRPLRVGEFACLCGNVIPPRTSRTGKEFICSECGRQGRVEDAVDPQTKSVMLKPVFTTEAAKSPTPTPVLSKPSEAPQGGTVLEGWTCVCGHSIDSQQVLARHEIDCPGCGRTVRLERYRHSQSTMIRVRPVATEKRAKPAAPETPPPGPSPTPTPSDAFGIDASGLPLPEDAPPLALPKDAQIALCECGAELLVSRDDLGHPIQCPACDVRIAVEEVPDLITGISTLRVRSIGKMDEENWSIDDFK